MIFLINNSFTIWVAIPMINKAYYTSSRYYYILSIDLLTFLITSLLILRATYIIIKYNIFHINLRIILIFQLCQWFEIVIARYLMFDYMIGRKVLGETWKFYHHFWTENREEMVPIDSIMGEWPLFLGSFLYTHHYSSCLFFLLSVSVERAVASVYLSDYELHTRPYISVLIIIVSMLFAAANSLIFALNFFTFASSVLLISFVALSSILLYAYVYRYNTKMISMPKEMYTLARRFQTEENLKSLTMAKYVVTTHAIYVALCEICLMSVYFGGSTDHWEIFIYIMDTVVYYSNMFIVTFVLYSVDTWREAFLKPFCFCRRKMNNRVFILEERNIQDEALKVSSVYFEQLGNAWR